MNRVGEIWITWKLDQLEGGWKWIWTWTWDRSISRELSWWWRYHLCPYSTMKCVGMESLIMFLLVVVFPQKILTNNFTFIVSSIILLKALTWLTYGWIRVTRVIIVRSISLWNKRKASALYMIFHNRYINSEAFTLYCMGRKTYILYRYTFHWGLRSILCKDENVRGPRLYVEENIRSYHSIKYESEVLWSLHFFYNNIMTSRSSLYTM